jgi:selenide,water dikinase
MEMVEGSGLSAKIDFTRVPLLPNIHSYLDQKCFPGGTARNLASYGHRLSDEIDERQRYIGADPQTSGGLLIAVEADHTSEFEAFALTQGLELSPIGELIHAQEKAIILA